MIDLAFRPAAAELGIDSTPIEGFNPATLNEILQIDTSKEETVVLLTLGYRDEANDHLANKPKLRKPLDELIEKINAMTKMYGRA